jgi:hypothetical protein
MEALSNATGSFDVSLVAVAILLAISSIVATKLKEYAKTAH